jgi:hypothetical protein
MNERGGSNSATAPIVCANRDRAPSLHARLTVPNNQ